MCIDNVYSLSFFFFNDTATTEISTLSLHDALPISRGSATASVGRWSSASQPRPGGPRSIGQPRSIQRTSVSRSSSVRDRKSTRLNSSHANISYAVFCLKKKKQTNSQIVL